MVVVKNRARLFSNQRPDIWVTVGPPPCSTLENMMGMIKEGGCALRLSYSFGTQERQKEIALNMKAIARLAERDDVILVADLEGGKMRLETFPNEPYTIPLSAGDIVRFVRDKSAFDRDKKIIPVKSQVFFGAVHEGSEITLGDGSACLTVVGKQEHVVTCKSLEGGFVHTAAGVTFQSETFQPRCLEEKDKRDLVFIASTGLYNAVAISFVGSADDVREARWIVDRTTPGLPVIAKIETPSGVKNAFEIAAESDAIMVACGDLALSAPWYELGNNADLVVSATEKANKPWIIATQLLQGLEHQCIPMRAEITNMTHWVHEGAAALVLADETAYGTRPVESVRAAKRIIAAALRR